MKVSSLNNKFRDPPPLVRYVVKNTLVGQGLIGVIIKLPRYETYYTENYTENLE